MRKLLVPLLVVASLAAAGAAFGKTTKTITIAKTGYTPTAVSLTTEDTLVFKNTDTVAHIVGFNSTTGLHCSAVVPLAVPAGQSASCTFASAGNFKFADAANKGKKFRGTITVTKPLFASLTVTPKAVVYGEKSTLAGKLASGQANQSVQIHAQMCGDTKSTLVATVMTTAGGVFTYQAQPSKKTAYVLSNKGLTAATAVSVAPSLQLSKLGPHRYLLQVSAAQSFVGKLATFQRYRPRLKHWVKVRRVALQTSAAGTAPTIVTSAKFRAGLRAGLKVRASLGLKQVGTCYLAGRSNVIKS